MHTLQQLCSGELQGIRRLDLSCGLTELPPEIYGLADTLEVLNLSDNALSTLPHELTRLKKLRVLFCSGNPFTVLPEVVGDCAELETVGFKACRIEQVPAAAISRQLRWLILTGNRVSELPRELGRCTRLQKLMLAGNHLQALPEAMRIARRWNCCASRPTASRPCRAGCSNCRDCRGSPTPATRSATRSKPPRCRLIRSRRSRGRASSCNSRSAKALRA